MEERIVKKMMTSVKCTSCGQNYQIRDVRIISNHEDLYFLQLSCSSCGSLSLFTAAVNSKNLDIITDLTDAELADSPAAQAPVSDDVLDMHAYLKEFDGDFRRLFKSKKV